MSNKDEKQAKALLVWPAWIWGRTKARREPEEPHTSPCLWCYLEKAWESMALSTEWLMPKDTQQKQHAQKTHCLQGTVSWMSCYLQPKAFLTQEPWLSSHWIHTRALGNLEQRALPREMLIKCLHNQSQAPSPRITKHWVNYGARLLPSGCHSAT